MINKNEIIDLINRNRFEAAISIMAKENQITHPEDVMKMLDTYRNKRQEHFIVITLDGAHKVIKRRVVTKGLVNKTVVHPREVFRGAIMDNACAVIVAHNHPSGIVDPSPEDIDITERLKAAGDVVGIPVLDHIIIGKSQSYSFITHGVVFHI